LTAGVAITTPWTLNPAPAPATGVLYGTLSGSTVQQSFTNSPPLTHLVGLQQTFVTPSITAGLGAGTTGTPTILIYSKSTDISGIVTVTAGTTPAANNTIATVTFAVPYSNSPSCHVWPAGQTTASMAAAQTPYVNYTSTTTAQFVIESNSTALTSGTAYQWGYTCVQ
jgi:hypothetical protein